MEVSWNRGTPSYHLFLDGIFPWTKPTILGYPNDEVTAELSKVWPFPRRAMKGPVNNWLHHGFNGGKNMANHQLVNTMG